MQIGIGDKLSDAQAYVDNGLTAYLIPHYDREDGDGMLDMAREIRRLRGKGRLNVVSGWDQVEAGISEGKKYPPGKFAEYLEEEGRWWKALEEEDEDDDDDDDD